MTEKRFTRNGYKIWDNVKNEEFYELHFRYEVEDICDELNGYEEKVNELSKENKQLKREKERYKRLSEIRDEAINNRILSLKEFINNCEDEKVKNILKDFFYSEVNEYDLAKENRELKKENEELKQKIKHFEVQLHCDSEEGVCIICNNHYLVKGKTYDKYYISKCKKRNEECSTEALTYCEDFELKGD